MSPADQSDDLTREAIELATRINHRLRERAQAGSAAAVGTTHEPHPEGHGLSG